MISAEAGPDNKKIPVKEIIKKESTFRISCSPFFERFFPEKYNILFLDVMLFDLWGYFKIDLEKCL
jgi:hypothetical protein